MKLAPLGKYKKTPSGVIFYEHVWKNSDSPYSYWSGFSLRPGVNRIDSFEKVGEFIEVGSFEKDYAVRYAEAKWKTAYLETTYAEHIGRKTSNRGSSEEKNAYNLNTCCQFERFVVESQPLEPISVKMNSVEMQRLCMSKVDSDNINAVAEIAAHVRLWIQLSRNFKTVQAYNIGNAAISAEILSILEGSFEPWDIVDGGESEGSSGGYLIHYTGAFKLLDHIRKHGILQTNVFDLFKAVNLNYSPQF